MTTELEALKAALSAATEEAATLKQRAQNAERLRKLLDVVVESVQERPAFTLHAMEKERGALDEAADDELRALLARVWSDAADRTQQASRDAMKTFPQALEALAVPIDPSSRHPRYSVAQRLVDVELDTRKHIAVIRPRHGDVVREPLDPTAVAARVKAECDRLLARPFDERAFLKKLTSAHAALAKPARKGGPAPTVMVRDLAVQMAKPGKPKLDEFAVDLGRLLSSSGGQGLQASHTRDTDKGLLLYGLEQGGYVGSIDVRSAA